MISVMFMHQKKKKEEKEGEEELLLNNDIFEFCLLREKRLFLSF